jgi:hypothetical protein
MITRDYKLKIKITVVVQYIRCYALKLEDLGITE